MMLSLNIPRRNHIKTEPSTIYLFFLLDGTIAYNNTSATAHNKTRKLVDKSIFLI